VKSRRYRWTLSAALTAAALLAGCKTVGPDYKGPPGVAVVNRPEASAPFVSADNPAFSREIAPGDWWRLYNDARLDDLIQQAFAANTDLRVAAANLERSQAVLRQVKAAREPSAEAHFDIDYAQLSPEAYLFGGSLPPMGLYDAGVGISYELDLFGRLHRAVQASAAEDEAVRAAYDLTKVTVAAATANAYAQACGAGEELETVRHSLALQQESDRLIHRLIKAGRSTALDATRSAGQVAQFQANIPALESAQRTALFRLAVLTGHAPSEYPKDLESCTKPPRLVRAIPVGDGAMLLRRRPDIREAERDLASATASIGVATAELYPKVVLGISAGSSGATSDFVSNPTNEYGIGPGITWQLNQSVARAKIAQAKATTQGTLAHFDGVVLNALREAESALTAYSHDLDRNADLKRVRDRAAEAEQQANQLHTNGRVDYLSLLDAQRTLASADDALATSNVQLSQDQVTIFLALGGGWDTPS
jgi:multidrug efflux system outer membrane protein